MLHCFFTCPFATQLWHALGFAVIQHPTMLHPDILHWLRNMSESHGVIIPITLWTLWCARNKKIFEEENPHLHQLAGRVFALTQLVTKAFGDMGFQRGCPGRLFGWDVLRIVDWL